MNFSDFLEHHTDAELAWILNYMEKEGVEHYEDLSVYKKFMDPHSWDTYSSITSNSPGRNSQ